MARSTSLIVALLLASACGGTAVIDPEAGQGGATTGSTTAATTTTSTGAGGCAFHVPELGSLCVRGSPGPSGEETIDTATPIRFEVAPSGCYSSSCTTVHQASCAVVSDAPPALELHAAFCLEDTSAQQGGCTDDCGGGGIASCDGIFLPEGGYSVNVANLTVLFTVPMTIPPGGACAGDPF
jgi:hypothetical protein